MNVLRSIATSILLVGLAANASAATFTVRSIDAAGVGLNDATPFTPVGGNNATTLGQARMNLLNEAARVWGTLLQSNVPILVDASFAAQTCSATSGTLGSAGPRSMYINFPGAPLQNVLYVSALADALSGANRSTNPTSSDINATFNSSVDSDPTCLGGRGFYYGFDHNRGTKIDLLLVMLHELGHGLGFTSEVDLTTGQGFVSGGVERFDSFTQNIFDEQLNKAWPAMTDSERMQSATHTGMLAWNGANTNAQTGRFTAGVTANGRMRLYAPATLSTGSSVSHFDTAVTPNVLMEPNLPSTITTSSTDITVCALQDAGWTVTQCPHFATNRPPVANPQSVTTLEDTPITITLTGSDPDNDPLTFAVATPPAKGTLSAISPTVPHTVVFTPTANANGADSFVFSVNDGSITTTATVTITITLVNDAPTAADVSTTAVTAQSTGITLQGNDVDGDQL
ncbi:MAG TPA: Ig-like domain-containing protein, partial [Steroidobacteraceae bacterium]|nr:Ig-like domain-containing protein [Steroidobacteraceae bacterium]